MTEKISEGKTPSAENLEEPKGKPAGLDVSRFGTVDAERPILFRLGTDSLVSLAMADDGPTLSLMTRDRTFGLIVREIDWVEIKEDKDGDEHTTPTHPPKEIVWDLIGIPPEEIPRVDRVITTPVFGPDGKLLVEPGLHADARIWHHPDSTLVLPPIPSNPSTAEVKAALGLFTDDLLVDFQFAGLADRAHAIALILLPLAREMIDGPTPYHLIESPIPGTGKNLTADAASLIATGTTCEGRTIPENGDEIRKMITSELIRGRPVILLDNLPDSETLDSATLASVVTAQVWSDRLLGQSRIISLPNRAVWMITGNNPSLTMELSRRCISIRIESPNDRPWLRDTFKHDPLREWIVQNRPRLVHAALVLIQAWVANGMKPGKMKPLGSFEHWSRVMGGILENAGVSGFLGNLLEMYEAVDEGGSEWREFVAAWWISKKDKEASVHDLALVCEGSGLMGSVRGTYGEQSQKIRLGKALRKAKDRIYDGFRIVLAKDDDKKGRTYRLEKVGVAADDGADTRAAADDDAGARTPAEDLASSRDRSNDFQ